MNHTILVRQRRCGLKYKTTKTTKDDMLLYLLKGQPSNLGMICAYLETTQKGAHQIMTNLRRKGYTITLSKRSWLYRLEAKK